MPGIKLVIFDLDGTLINAYAAIADSFNYVMRKFKLKPLSGKSIRGLVGWGDKSLLQPFLSRGDLKKGLILYRRHQGVSLVRKSRLYPQVKELLGFLKQKGYKLAVASNRPTRFSLILLRHLGLENYFDYVLCADKISRGKPHPQILNTIRKRFRVKPDEVLYVGDMPIDLQAGLRAGIKTVLVGTGSSSIRELQQHRPYLLLSEVSRLKRFL